MIRFSLAALFAFACVPRSPEPVQRARGLQPARSTAEALAASLEPKRVAVLVGVDAYDDPSFPALQHSGHDADLLAGVLRDPAQGGFDEVTLLAGSPTRQQVLDTLRGVGRDLRREDVLVVYFSGHGTRVEDGDRLRRFLLQRDSRAADLETTAMELEALQTWFTGLTPARKALVVDACFNGDGKSIVRPADRDVPLPETLTPASAALGAGEAHLFATSPGRPALEDDQLGHGVYTYFLIEALSWSFDEADRDRDGVVTAWEAHDHARTRTLERTGDQQVPEMALRVVGTADLVLAGRPRERRRRDQALVYLYPPPSHPLAGATITVDGRPRGALPGTVAVDPGRHHVGLSDAEGGLIAQGHVTLIPGRPYRAEDLQRLLRGPSLGFGLRPVAAIAPAFSRSFAGAAPGLELHGYGRDDESPGRGLYASPRIAVHGAGSRTLGARALDEPRTMATIGVELGVQQDWRRLRGKAGWTLQGVWIPPDWLDGRPGAPVDPYAVRSEAGWIFGATGPSASAGWVFDETWSLVAQVRPTLALLDLDGDGRTSPVLWTTVGIGPEIVLR